MKYEFTIINNGTNEQLIIDLNVLQLLVTFYKDITVFAYPKLASKAQDALTYLLLFDIVSVDNILYNEIIESVLTDI